MYQRSSDDIKHELDALDQAHAQNEVARDSFVALAHTALFAASVSFVGSAVPLAKAVWPAVLIGGWAFDVVGLLSLTISFATARTAIDARREALYADTPPIAIWSDRLNSFALWSFPAALLCLFSFVTANVVHINDQQAKSAAITTTAGARRIERNSSAAPGAITAGRGVGATGRSCTGTKSADRATTATTAHKGVGQVYPCWGMPHGMSKSDVQPRSIRALQPSSGSSDMP